MTDKQYKIFSVLDSVSAILILISFFWGFFHAVLMPDFKITLLFVILCSIALFSLVYLIGFFIWSFTSKTGRDYWMLRYKHKQISAKGKYQFNTPTYGEHPADTMKSNLLRGLLAIVGILLMVAIYGVIG